MSELIFLIIFFKKVKSFVLIDKKKKGDLFFEQNDIKKNHFKCRQ